MSGSAIPILDRIWKIIKKEPEALNDEDEGEWRQDSFWTFWLNGGGDMELVHGLKAILHNRGIRQTLRPENDPKIVKVRLLKESGRLGFAELTVQESDVEDPALLVLQRGLRPGRRASSFDVSSGPAPAGTLVAGYAHDHRHSSFPSEPEPFDSEWSDDSWKWISPRMEIPFGKTGPGTTPVRISRLLLPDKTAWRPGRSGVG